MKLGLGLYAGMATEENLRFAKQMGATHIVAHLPGQETFLSSASGVWSFDDLARLQRQVAGAGLALYAIENFPPHHWDQILLGDPGRDAQMENLKATIRNMGRAGIPCMGYYFSLAGVWARVKGPFARGGAESVGFLRDQMPEETPIPHGEVWGTKITDDASPGALGTVTHEQMWERLTYFLENLVPVAEEAGVRLAAHPDDPPVPVLRGTARLITHPDHYKRLVEIVPSPANGLEFCQGTVAEMEGSDVYAAIRYFCERRKICYVHFRNVKGRVPNYREVFLDEGDVDMIEAMRIYHETGFDGVLLPDHTPATSCAAPWHAGMAFALGYMRATLKHLGAG
ncbi:MAG: D-mannonate dehydratase [Armatimonadetes bacterium CG_4_10_14_3_um_filter_66_18]|nr:TIM barrel protein [Armatimonadota bacterium]OIO94612.1 MAG: D-mannonate dehydratase [Armatimonadetes bacterium CG2_30_66_41]PIU95095.1 MAG: D-mannonate dehydratase [Armatimonadetes bacterium CG06_land_8_20_14_3_00_66_21]PIX41036.1 MAG: D-mannonate dehydratase [Armatimonadetes bacterium CG_4_8_14_3_um_filter_66_20]PIY48981.1 MAG: D-mannonate dehydratase [Armatimonadetes bacterium CG_4_10_14_3_um_filter_66_18]PIZ35160.1 MAG: D-mannonate dehydratase [Armatimonadetes bacterium CG_4_10_14_0_8_u